MQIDEDVLEVLNESKRVNESKYDNSDFKVGDQVYLWGDSGIGNDKWEIIEITNSHDEKLKEDRTIPYESRPIALAEYTPDEPAFPVAILKQITGNKIGRLLYDSVETRDNIESNRVARPTYYFIAADVVESIDPANIDLTEFANSLQDALNEKDVKIKGLTCYYTDPKAGIKYGKIHVKSDNLVNECGLWAFAVKEIYLDDWGGSYTSPENRTITLDLHLSYKHWTGGTNGIELGRATYNIDTKEWDILLEKDRQRNY